MVSRVDPSLTPIAPRERTARPADATDFKQFAELRRGAGAHDPATLREVARQFESLFTKMMLESMRSASFGDPMFGSDQVDMYQDMMDDQLAVQLSQGKGLGLADLLIRQLSQAQANPASPGSSGPDTASAEQRARFIDEIRPHAEAAARELGVDPRGIIAQAALETGWGTSQPADDSGASHNLFGIKAGVSWRGASVQSETQEYVAGVAGRENARFRAYGSVAESVADYVRVLRSPRYTAALNTGTDVHAFATALQKGGYATDPEYANKLVAISRQLADGGGVPPTVKPFKSAAAAPISTQEPMSNG
jgi:flagellar protein FlgJ